MRRMRWTAIGWFTLLAGVVLAAALASAWHGAGLLPGLGDFRGIIITGAAMFLTYLYAIVALRALLAFAPLHAGAIEAGSRQEFRYQVYILSYLFLFNALLHCRLIPIPLMRLVYLALGARMGANTHCAGIMFDPMFVTIGANSLLGEGTLLIPHVIEGTTLAHYSIAIGNDVTIGARALLLAGVTVGDGAIIAANAVVLKGERIGAGEVWGGIPARLLGRVRNSGAATPAAPATPRAAAHRTVWPESHRQRWIPDWPRWQTRCAPAAGAP